MPEYTPETLQQLLRLTKIAIRSDHGYSVRIAEDASRLKARKADAVARAVRREEDRLIREFERAAVKLR
ncbi:hypothetical protein B0I08_101336 [Glaciihabitans tibetensis]|uniref:Uncharacterized protein n=1 Tax=Glaciihabitans tibetensis TaxID=1266600 RepID=A0A2T0VJ12_9MICO|nr:hypothetical protein B0I08_101336 [Glaciihabitans tibetensis]